MNDYIGYFLSAFVGMVAGWVIKPAFEGFARRKGEILAELAHAGELEQTKALGRKAVDQENEVHKAQLAARNSMRAASIEKRMAVHQEAFALWWELRNAVHGDPAVLSRCVLKCQAWWVENCLYLDARPREDFSLAYSSASLHPNYVSAPARDEAATIALKENWARIMAPGLSLPQAVELPAIAEDRRRPDDPPSKIGYKPGTSQSKVESS